MDYKLHAVNDPTLEGLWYFESDALEELREALSEANLLDEETPMPPAPPGGDLAALLAWRSQSSRDPHKVAAWKFKSDAGWLVTPAECALLAQGEIQDDTGTITAFQSYCRRCISKGGFQIW